MYDPELFEAINGAFTDFKIKCLKEAEYNEYKAGDAFGVKTKQYYLAKSIANRLIKESIDDWRNEIIYKLMKEDDKNV